ncbi:MAG TPA: diacylglycerol kinase family protein [Micromonosporaceae bacterium]
MAQGLSQRSKRLVVIYNAAAGGASEAARAAASGVLRQHADVAEAAVDSPDQVVDVLAGHPGRDPVAVGGDGTVHQVVAALARGDELATRTVGLIPLGTGNDLARSLGLPVDPAAAARVVLAGKVRLMDLLVDDAGGIAVNAVHLGVGGEASAAAQPLKPLLRRLAYAAGAVVAGLRTTGWRLRVEVDGRTVADGRRRVLMVGIGNGATIGGGTPLAPDADPGDTRADVVVSFATGLPQRLWYGVQLRRGEHSRRKDVIALRGRRITVSGEPTLVNADGELGGVVIRRTWSILPRSWRITVPDRPA